MDESFDPARPFRRSAALAAGISDASLRSKGYQRLLDGVHVASHVTPDPMLMAEALLLVTPPGSWVSHASAARWHGCPLPAMPEEHVTVMSRRLRFRRKGVRCHVARSGATVVNGSRVSSPAQCFLELAEQLSLVELVIVGDWLVRKGKVRLAALRERCATAAGPAAPAARLAASYVRERVDSPMETRLRLLIVLAGLPEPQVNISVEVNGTPVRRYDLSWPEARAIVEYDGRHHVERVEQWEADLARREAIDDDEWRILVVTSRGVFDDPGATLERIERLLRKRRLPGMPAQLSNEWRRHFPAKGPL